MGSFVFVCLWVVVLLGTVQSAWLDVLSEHTVLTVETEVVEKHCRNSGSGGYCWLTTVELGPIATLTPDVIVAFDNIAAFVIRFK
jgi:hypothetical protein